MQVKPAESESRSGEWGLHNLELFEILHCALGDLRVADYKPE